MIMIGSRFHALENIATYMEGINDQDIGSSMESDDQGKDPQLIDGKEIKIESSQNKSEKSKLGKSSINTVVMEDNNDQVGGSSMEGNGQGKDPHNGGENKFDSSWNRIGKSKLGNPQLTQTTISNSSLLKNFNTSESWEEGASK